MAAIYEVETRRLNEQVKRNIEHFRDDFMFQLTVKEWNSMMSQFATSSLQSAVNQKDKNMMSQIATSSQKKRRQSSPPLAFTEHGVTMLASVLKSERALR